MKLTITDNDSGEIIATVEDQNIRAWSYKDDAERRIKMLSAREFLEGWFQATKRFAVELVHVRSK